MKKGLALLLALVLCLSMAACGDTAGGRSDDDSEDSTGHTCSGEWVVWEEATCFKDGTRQRTCSCGEVVKETIPMLTHEYADGICTLCNTADPNYKPTPTSGLIFTSMGDNYCYLSGMEAGAETDVVVPETSPAGEMVVGISNEAFKNSDKITSIWIPDSVYSIGEDAFAYSKTLTKVVIGNNVTQINNYAFAGCDNLKTVSMGSNVSTLGHCVFRGCRSLTKINLPHTLYEMGQSVFEQCEALEGITIPDGIAEVKVKTFRGCTSLQSVVLGKSVEKIGASVFQGCSRLEKVTIPAGFQSVGEQAFADCSALKIFDLADVKTWCSLRFEAYNDVNPVSQGCGLYIDGKPLTDLVVPEGIELYNNFSGCTSLVTVTLPDTLTIIPGDAFKNCTNLTTVNMSDKVYYILAGAFSGCSSLTAINLGNHVSDIGSEAFSGCTSLTEFVIPASVTSINLSAFEGCTGLKKVTLNILVPPDMFKDCTALEEIYIPAAMVEQYRNYSGWQVFEDILKFEGSEGGIIQKPSEGLEFTSNKNGTCKVTGIGSCKDKVIVIPETAPNGDTVVAIGAEAFDKCYQITKVIIPNTVTEIGTRAFKDCSGLQSMDLPESVTTLSACAFDGCTNLATLTIRSKTVVSCPYYNIPHNQGCNPQVKTVYVPADLVDTYKTTGSWMAMDSLIKPIP
ncbi:MAG: leucine-rich repeat domain-containing protein [Ruminococcaceae bacterium]|nr:leucine-rich repeat domain-containing protein [Oscillospiraceae bacterium]